MCPQFLWRQSWTFLRIYTDTTSNAFLPTTTAGRTNIFRPETSVTHITTSTRTIEVRIHIKILFTSIPIIKSSSSRTPFCLLMCWLWTPRWPHQAWRAEFPPNILAFEFCRKKTPYDTPSWLSQAHKPTLAIPMPTWDTIPLWISYGVCSITVFRTPFPIS